MIIENVVFVSKYVVDDGEGERITLFVYDPSASG